MAENKQDGAQVGRENLSPFAPQVQAQLVQQAETAKRIKASRLDHDLHVALLMKRLKLSKPDAIVMAYLDGRLGLEPRLEGQVPDVFNTWDREPGVPKKPEAPKA